MLNKKFVEKVKQDYEKYEIVRRTIIKHGNEILHKSKQAIFALHRKEPKEASRILKEAEKENKNLISKINSNNYKLFLKGEGSYKAALEEYAEAKLFDDFINKREINEIKEIDLTYEAYLGALCDFTGELVRYGIAMATEKNYQEFDRTKKAIEEALGELIKLNLSGYFRTKFDQAKNNLRKIEEINYQLSLKK